MMSRTEALELLARHRTNEIVVNTMTTSWEWPLVSNNPDLDFPVRQSMGQAAPVGLGFALARPERRVWVLNGDGSQLMYLGSIGSIADNDARNLVLFVFGNDQYEVTGGQPIPLAGRVDFTAVARGLGMSQAYAFDELSHFESRLPEILRQEGPILVYLKVAAGSLAKTRPGWNPVGDARRVMQALASGAEQ